MRSGKGKGDDHGPYLISGMNTSTLDSTFQRRMPRISRILTVLDGNNRRGLVSGTSQIVVLLTPTDPKVIFLVHLQEAK